MVYYNIFIIMVLLRGIGGCSSKAKINRDLKLTKGENFPYHVFITGSSGRMCNGVLISKTFVLTTASCLKDKKNINYFIFADKTPYNGLVESFQKIPVKNVTVHNDYRNEEPFPKHDIALLQLNSSVRVSEWAYPGGMKIFK
ncbi:vitamin K-dependent protein Z-like [Copidosoma floridanum]|uniref:vitamin K-dependent protein Z-like n=1 Tax=Copidosoma floridanum TaxID=29053 RepID=UPI0006C9AC8B|nr:vitamin K-dependent protein Z-like [Copidosoma floridanum]